MRVPFRGRSRAGVLAALAGLWAALGTIAGAAPVDEPLGARDSLGLTLWHLGRQPARIAEFHAFVRERGLSPERLLPPEALRPPEQIHRILVEPELLPADLLAGWRPEGGFLTSGATDAGPTVSFPLRVGTGGLYRLWVRYYGWPTGTAVTGLRLYRSSREGQGPVLNDEIYDYAVEREGLAWKDVLVDLEAGDYLVRLSHVTRWWHAGNGPGGYLPRRIDCLYLTDAIWADPPADADLQQIRETGAPERGFTWSAQEPLPAQTHETWRWWQVRPVSWEQADARPDLFALSRAFWRQLVDRLGAADYGDEVPDYRAPERQVVFDDIWNMVANPVRLRRQIEALRSDIRGQPAPDLYYWLEAADFQTLPPGWSREGTSIVGGYWDFGDVAETELTVSRADTYTVWVRFGLLKGYFAPWRLTVREPGGNEVAFDRDRDDYDSEWQRVGLLEVSGAGPLHIAIRPLAFRSPGTYRRIHDILVTTDREYVPRGSVRPPVTREQYLERARALGAPGRAPLLAWLPQDPFAPFSQTSWPKQPVPAPPLTQRLVMARDSVQSVAVLLRSLSVEPLPLTVRCGPLVDETGRQAGSVTWRVAAFVPYGNSRQEWSPFCLLRRPGITVPPLNLAALWLTVDARGAVPGRYNAEVALEGPGLNGTLVRLSVLVAPRTIAPREPVLVGGWTAPPEGEPYLRDYVEHGMNIWYGELPRAEMQRWGIRLLALAQGDADEAAIRTRIERLRRLGLDEQDWVFTILDEPTAATEEGLKPFLDIARAIRAADPRARICFNPGEAASLATFRILDPWCDVWLPYRVHLVYPPAEKDAKRALFTAKPWLWYETPCLWDKSPALPRQLYDQIRAVPAQPGPCLGTAFFALYYPFRDPWDTAYEHIPDAAALVLPSRHGPVATRAWEAVREGSQHANLARMVRERAGKPPYDPELQKRIESGSVEDLLAWLDAHGN